MTDFKAGFFAQGMAAILAITAILLGLGIFTDVKVILLVVLILSAILWWGHR
jgi:hypothetical protein